MKHLKIALVAVLAIVGCTSTKGAKSMEEFEQFYQQVVEKYQARVEAIQQSAEADGSEEAFEKAYEEAVESIVDFSLATIKTNCKDTLAVEVLSEVNTMLTPEQKQKALDYLRGPIREHRVVVAMSGLLNAQKATAAGKMFTDFEVDGVKFSDFVGKGKYVLVDFWASWCGPCKREIPNIKHVYETYAGENFDVLSVAVWDKPEDTKRAAAEHGVVWSQIINAQRIPTDIYGIEGIPHIMLVGPDGVIIRRDLRGEQIEKAVKEALGL